MRKVLPSATSQTIQFDAVSETGAAVVLAHNSAGLEISVKTVVNGRPTLVPLTLVARDVSRAWKSSAIENIGGTSVHEVDIPNSAFAISTGTITLEIVSPDVIAAPAEILEIDVSASELNATANRITILAAIPGVSAIAAACWAYIITGSTSAATIMTSLYNYLAVLVGLGANAVTITVNDGATAIQSAVVSAWSGSTLVATGTTNVSGVVVLSLNSATYSINITAAGFNGSAGNSLVVSGATSQTYSLTAIAITPSDPPEVTGYLYCYDQFGNTQAGVPHTLVLQTAPSGDAGASLSQRPRTVVSASDGLVEFTGLVQGAVYTVKRADGPQTRFTADTVTFAITDLAG